jgi:Swiss Army Knife RNA repair-like protein
MSKPILAVDIDGVVSLFGFEEPPPKEEAQFELVDGMVHCISLLAGNRLIRLAEHYDLVWASGWEDRANDYLPNILGLPQLPHLTFNGNAEFGSAHWKLGPIDKYCKGRATAWIDDNFDESCYEWARGREEPTLLVPTEPHLGLEEAQTEALAAWARGI